MRKSMERAMAEIERDTQEIKRAGESLRRSVERYQAESQKARWSSGDAIKQEREEMTQYVSKEQMRCNAEETQEISQHLPNQIKKARAIGTTGTRPTIDIGGAVCWASLAGKLWVSDIGPSGNSKERERYDGGNSDID